MHPKKHRKRILFILKERKDYDQDYDYGGDYAYGVSSGLYNSAMFCADVLADHNYVVKVVEVVDNNSIDMEVTLFRPDICIIEALWVIPSKFDILTKLHPHVKWIVRVHSEAPFLAQEGIAIKWLSLYPKFENVYVSMNSLEGLTQLLSFYPGKQLDTSRVLYLPTCYPHVNRPHKRHFEDTTINIACMGAIRQLKNTLMQAIAAIRFADDKGWKLRFHVNIDVSQDHQGNNPYKNLVNLFANTSHELVTHPWVTHHHFIQFLSEVDMGMQVSFSETFCIVAADMVSVGLPLIGSDAIHWLDKKSMANPIVVNHITQQLHKSLNHHKLVEENVEALTQHSKNASITWRDVIFDVLQ